MATSKKLTVRLTKEEFRFINDLTIEVKAGGGSRPSRGQVVRAFIRALDSKSGKSEIQRQLKSLSREVEDK